MPPTLVNVAVGVVLGVALLGAAFDRRSLAAVALAAALPDLDAAVSLLVDGATNAVLHSGFVPLVVAGLLYWDSSREHSWLRRRYGWYGVRLAWVALASYAVAGIGLDLFNTESVAVLYPLSNRYYAIVGKLVVSTQEGIVQTYVGWGKGWIEVASPGTTETHRVGSWLNPAGERRRARIVDSGWQAVVLLTAVVAAPAKWLLEGGDS